MVNACSQSHMKLDALMQTEVSGKSNLKGEVELFQYGGLLFRSAGTGFVRHCISLKFNGRPANIHVKNAVL